MNMKSHYIIESSQEYKAILNWVQGAQKIAPEICNWIGIYFKESFVGLQNSTDLVLGPYIGDPTEHTRISISKGICGLALREEKVINVADVRSRTEHIACSVHTRSELVIPLKDENGKYIAELDIDSNKLNAFNPELEERFRTYCESFALVIS